MAVQGRGTAAALVGGEDMVLFFWRTAVTGARTSAGGGSMACRGGTYGVSCLLHKEGRRVIWCWGEEVKVRR